MNDFKLIKKILNLTRYDFIQNFTNLLFIAGLHAVIISIIFCSLCFLSSSCVVGNWANISGMFFDCGSKLLFLIEDGSSYLLLGFIGLMSVLAIIFLPLIIMQNCLDLAFDSSMSGYSISKKSMALSFVAMLIPVVGVAAYISIIFKIFLFEQVNFMQSFSFPLYFFMCKILYLVYLISFLGMHVLEYKLGLVQSFQDVIKMIWARSYFVFKTFVVQILLAGSFLAIFYFCFEIVMKFFIEVALWPFNVLQLSISPVFVLMISNFFYLWVYILLYAWICLVTAHVYRQLVCPPVDTSSCSSCKSCEK
jgi:hypothetical protein